MRIQNRFDELLAIKSRKEGRRLSRRTVARETGISLTSVQNWANNNIKQFNEDQIAAFCKYFNCTIADLLIMVPEGEEHPESKSLLVAEVA